MPERLLDVLLACGGSPPPHTCLRQARDDSLGEACPRLTACVQALYPWAPCTLVRFRLRADGGSSLPFVCGNFERVQHMSPEGLREDTALLFTLLHPQDFDRVLVSMTQAARTVSTWLQEYRILPPEGGVRWLRTCLAPHRIASDQLTGYGVIVDISAEKKCREDLLALCEHGSIGIYRADMDGRYLSVNDHYARICGYDSAEEFLGRVPSTGSLYLTHPEERDAVVRILLAQGSFQRYAMELRTKDGGSAWISLNLRGIRGPGGQLESYEAFCADITEQMRRELAQGRCSEFEHTSFGQGGQPGPRPGPQAGPPDAKKPAGAPPDGLCPVLAYVRDAILWRVRLPQLP